MRANRTLLLGLLCALAPVAGCALRGAHAGTPSVAGHFAAAPDIAARRAYDQLREQVAAEPGAVRTSSGLVYRELTVGRGAPPRDSDTVTVRFQVKTADGRVVEDSATYGGAVTVLLDQVRPCLHEAVLRMKAGGVSRFVCPPPGDDDGERAAPNLAPVALETTLVAVGQPLPPPGH